jgi:alanine or glycine:cation symporter, AGCS family
LDIINGVIDFLNGIIWSQALIYLCLITGLYFSIRTKFLQVRLIGPMVKLMFEGKDSKEGISSFQALCTALAGRVGTGNIAGTATAIFYGGPGALVWMWIIAFLGASSAFVEAALAQLWKTEIDGEYRGGPAYYIEKGMKSRWYAMVFSVSTLFACGLLLPGVQANSIANAFNNVAGIPTVASGVVIAAVLALIIFGGIKRIARTAEIIVPVMAVVYILMALVIIFINIDKLGAVLSLVFGSAFGANATFGGILGSAVSWGVKRGIYSNEAGQGSAPHAAAAAEVSHPAKQGLVQAFSVYIDTLFVCSATGFMILMTNSYNVLDQAAGGYLHIGAGATMEALAEAGTVGPQFTQVAVGTVVGNFGGWFVAICLAFFAFTTIMAYYYQAESNVAYIFRNQQSARRSTVTLILRIAIIVAVIYSTYATATAAWNAGDVGVGLMAWINIIALWILQKPALALLKDYEAQKKAGKDPTFNPDDLGNRYSY